MGRGVNLHCWGRAIMNVIHPLAILHFWRNLFVTWYISLHLCSCLNKGPQVPLWCQGISEVEEIHSWSGPCARRSKGHSLAHSPENFMFVTWFVLGPSGVLFVDKQDLMWFRFSGDGTVGMAISWYERSNNWELRGEREEWVNSCLIRSFCVASESLESRLEEFV